MRCTVKFFLNQVTCPGTLHLPDRNPVYLSIYLFGRFHRSQHVYPSFPMVFTSKIKFQRLFTNAKTPEQVLEILEDETILIELRQHTKGLKGGKILAEFEESTRTFLFPTPSYIPKQDQLKREVLLTRTESFPHGKGLDPQLSFRTKTYIEEGPYVESIHHIPVNRQIPPSEISPPSKVSPFSKIEVSDKKHTKRKRKGKKKSLMIYPTNINQTDENDAEHEQAGTPTKKHCICNCPSLLDDSFSIDYWLDALNSRRQRKSKVKPFRTGKDSKNLISKREFSDSGMKVKRLCREGICKSCIIPLPSCVLCNAYKSVYGRHSFLIHRFKKRNRKSLNNSDLNSGHSNGNSPKSPGDHARVKDSYLSSKYISPKEELVCVPEEILNGSMNNRLMMMAGNHKKGNSKMNGSYVSTKYTSPQKNVDFIADDDLDDYTLPPRASSRISRLDPLNEYTRTRSAPSRSVRSTFFSHPVTSYHHSEEELYELELERIRKRIRDLMKKNESVLQNDLCSSDSITDDEEIEGLSSTLSSSLDDSPLDMSSRKKLPSRSIVSPLRSAKKWTQNFDGDFSHRDKLESRLKAIYSELYEKTLNDL